MKKYIVITILLSCFFTTFISADVTPEYKQVLEDIGIMSAIIDKTLAKAFPGEYKEPQFIFPREMDKCQGFYLKDYGALFMVDVGFPVSEAILDKEKKQNNPDDLWMTTKQELNGVDVFTYTPIQHQSFDQAKVDRIKDELLKSIGDYSNNIRQLRPDDKFTIIIKGGKSNIIFGSDLLWRKDGNVVYPTVTPGEAGIHWVDPTPAQTTAEPAKALKAPTQAVLEQHATAIPAPSTGIASGTASIELAPPVIDVTGIPSNVWVRGADGYGGPLFKGPQTTMIITVKKGDVTDLKDGKIKLEDFAKRAEIVQY